MKRQTTESEDQNRYFSQEDIQMTKKQNKNKQQNKKQKTTWKDAQHHQILEKCKSKLL